MQEKQRHHQKIGSNGRGRRKKRRKLEQKQPQNEITGQSCTSFIIKSQEKYVSLFI
jgi:hypothetical protein